MERYRSFRTKGLRMKTAIAVLLSCGLLYVLSVREAEAEESSLKFSVNQYDEIAKLKPFVEAQADTIEATPLKLNIQGTYENDLAVGSNVRVEFDVVSNESYALAPLNKLVKMYMQTEETKTYSVEMNRDFFISTKSRLDRSGDDNLNTLYLENTTREYQIRVKVFVNNVLHDQIAIAFVVIGESDSIPGGQTELELLLQGERDNIEPMKISFKWNYHLPTGQLLCLENGIQKIYNVSGTGAILAAKNQTYDCHLSAYYEGELLNSNHVVIYPDATLPAEGSGGIQKLKVDANIYTQETRLGVSYIINSNAKNFKGEYIPIPLNDITKH